jgi:nitrite reductase/ring-hydroxylating ferredoxin subunit
MYKQRFSLRSGRCVEDPTATLGVWDARVAAGVVQVRRPR